MIQFLVTAQHETAIIRDSRVVLPVLRCFPRSIVYFNIDSHMPQNALEQIIRGVLNTQEEHGAEVGILSYNKNDELAQHYLMDLGVTCGYVTLSLGFEKSARIVIKALEAVEARGKRQYVRVKAPTGKASLNIASDADQIEGTIIDISIVGLAAILSNEYTNGTYFESVQLKLWGTLLTVGATVAGTRKTPLGTVTVLMFDEITDGTRRGKIYAFLKRVMQHEVDAAT
jgi:hypothetical protein